MATISIYQAEDNRTYQVTVDVFTSVLDQTYLLPSNTYDIDYYLRISTTLRKSIDNSSFPTYVVRTLNDVPPGYSAASSFTELVDDYVEYFIAQAELGMSSSSSESSSSSSSFGLTSSSSSSSTAVRSSSSSSSSTEVRSSSSSSSSSPPP